LGCTGAGFQRPLGVAVFARLLSTFTIMSKSYPEIRPELEREPMPLAEVQQCASKASMSRVQRQKWYAKNLDTPEMDRLREEVFKLHKYRCQVCGRSTHLELHHKTYDGAPQDSKPRECECLCKRCHAERTSVDESWRLLSSVYAIPMWRLLQAVSIYDSQVKYSLSATED